MLAEMDAGHLSEWAALLKIDEEDRLQEEAAARAEAKHQDYRRGSGQWR